MRLFGKSLISGPTQIGNRLIGKTMKTLNVLLACIAALALVFTGCKKSGVDTKPLERSFSSADTSAKNASDNAVAAIKAGDYAGAMAQLGSLASQAKLTPEQQQAIKDTLEQVKQQLAATAEKAGKEMQKGMEDMQKTLKK